VVHSLQSSRQPLFESCYLKLGVCAYVSFIFPIANAINCLGFLCPVHTPDGSPCGLLNHLSRTCRIVATRLSVAHIPGLLAAHGMTQAFAPSVEGQKNLCIQLDGRVVGWARPSVAQQLATNLRIWKTQNEHNIPPDLEIGFVPVSKGGQYPGLFLFSSPSRMMRPVKYLANGRDDQIGSFEQVYLNIACLPSEIEPRICTHVEHSPTNFLSILANLTPFSDFNQVILTSSDETLRLT
jgi:DNA-directed RNA polymerase I subunit RPA2